MKFKLNKMLETVDSYQRVQKAQHLVTLSSTTSGTLTSLIHVQ